MQQQNSMNRRAQAEQSFARLKSVLDKPYFFVHVNKCGGTSVAAALNIAQLHGSVKTMIKLFGPGFFASRKAFSVVRRPYERMCSLYRYRVKRNEAEFNGRTLELNEWVYRAVKLQDPQFVLGEEMMKPALDWMVDSAGNNLVDLVVQLENIEEDWGKIQALTGCKAELPRMNATRSTPETSIAALSSESREIIEDFFDVDFDTFGYDRFEAAAWRPAGSSALSANSVPLASEAPAAGAQRPA